jgi:hypothetical protein
MKKQDWKRSRFDWRLLLLGLLSQIVPACFVVFVSFYLMQKTSMPFFWGMPLAITWGALGATIHYLSIKRGLRFRMIWTAIFAVFTVGAGLGLAKAFEMDFSRMKACPVCGFVALNETGEACPVCNVRFTHSDAEMEGYSSLHDYLVAEQLMFFQPAPGDTVVDFYAPCNSPEQYPKSASWRPSVTAQDVREVQRIARPSE